ncbi:MAG: PKD domain-containing protein, partial [Vicingus serpentipes]|nr:PKD domain-containing protein [Vicingus serpentipes]
AGKNLTIHQAAINNTPGMTFSWFSDAGLTIPVPTPTSVTVSNGQIFYVLVTNTATGCVDTATVTYTVNPLPVPDAGIDQAICIGDNATITASSTGANPIGFTWDNGLPATAGPHTVSPTATTTYTVTATDNNGCVNTDAVIITVNPLPTPDAGVNQTICLNSSTTIRAISGGTGPFSFVWDNGLPTGAGPHTVSPGVGTTTYHVVVTDANGCVNNDSVSVTVNPIPTINAGNDTTICEGQSATLMATGAGVGGTYQWKDLTTGLPLAAGASLLVQPTAANTCYEVTGTDAVGCFSTDVVCVTVEQAPVIGFNVSDVCHGTTSTFNNTTTGAATYSWTFGDGNSSNVFSPQHVYTDTGTYTVTLTATSTAGCVSTITQTTRVNYTPSPLFSGDVLENCPPFNTYFSNFTNTPIDPSFDYLWDFGDGKISRDTTPTHLYTKTGTYTVTLTVTTPQGCPAVYTMVDYVTVYPVPDAQFTADPSIVDIYNPLINFTDLSIGADRWFWDFGDTKGAIEQHPVHIYTDTGSFTVWLRVENSFGCEDSISKSVVVKDVYTFYAPNAFTPDGDGVNDIFLPQGHAIDEDEYTLYIFDRWGELIHETHDYYEGWNGTYKGTPVQIDTYVWKVDLQDIYGANHKYIGRVNIVK